MAEQKIVLRKKTKISFDFLTLFAGVFLFGIGLVSLYSCLSASEMLSLFWRQVIYGGIGIVAAIGMFFVPNKWLRSISIPVYAVSILLLIVVLTPLGTKINGTQGWIRFAGFSLQPAELAKPAVLLFSAWRLSNKYSDIKHLSEFLLITTAFLVPLFLIMLQPDFGSFSVIIVLFYGVLYWSGFSGFILYTLACIPILAVISLIDTTTFYIVAGVMTVLGFFFKRKLIMPIISGALYFLIGFLTPVVKNSLKDFQQARIDTFLNPEADPLGNGYNVLQSIIAIGSGGIFGKGYMQGTQTQLRFIPMQWTDFIFSVPLEEFGLIGGAVIIILFVILLWRGVKIASEATNRFNSIIAAGSVVIILYHCLINMGMTMGVMPVTGIPLPFLSYGGTSLLINFLLIGLLLNINKLNKEEQVKYDS